MARRFIPLVIILTILFIPVNSLETRADSHLVYFQIWSIEADNQVVDARPGERVQLRLNVYDKDDNSLNAAVDETIQDDAVFRWIGEGEFREVPGINAVRKSGRADDRVVEHTVSRNPGVYTVVAGIVVPDLCGPQRPAGCSGRSITSFTIRSTRYTPVGTASAEPMNPTGPVPSLITDDAGNRYSVAVPVQGGEASSGNASITIPKGAIRSETFVGIRIAPQDIEVPIATSTRNIAPDDDSYVVNIVNRNGIPLLDYRLGTPATVCLPMPERFLPYLSDVIVIEGINPVRFLTSIPRFDTQYGWRACGTTSSLPGTFTVAIRGGVADLFPPTPTPAPTQEPIIILSVGGAAPTANNLALVSLLGAIVVAAGLVAIALTRRRRTSADKLAD